MSIAHKGRMLISGKEVMYSGTMPQESSRPRPRYLVTINGRSFYLRGRQFEYLARLAAHKKINDQFRMAEPKAELWKKVDGWMHLDNLVDHCPTLRGNVARYIYCLRKALGKFGDAVQNDRKQNYRLNWPGENIDFDSQELRKYPHRAIMDIGLTDWKEREKRCIKA